MKLTRQKISRLLNSQKQSQKKYRIQPKKVRKSYHKKTNKIKPYTNLRQKTIKRKTSITKSSHNKIKTGGNDGDIDICPKNNDDDLKWDANLVGIIGSDLGIIKEWQEDIWNSEVQQDENAFRIIPKDIYNKLPIFFQTYSDQSMSKNIFIKGFIEAKKREYKFLKPQDNQKGGSNGQPTNIELQKTLEDEIEQLNEKMIQSQKQISFFKEQIKLFNEQITKKPEGDELKEDIEQSIQNINKMLETAEKEIQEIVKENGTKEKLSDNLVEFNKVKKEQDTLFQSLPRSALPESVNQLNKERIEEGRKELETMIEQTEKHLDAITENETLIKTLNATKRKQEKLLETKIFKETEREGIKKAIDMLKTYLEKEEEDLEEAGKALQKKQEEEEELKTEINMTGSSDIIKGSIRGTIARRMVSDIKKAKEIQRELEEAEAEMIAESQRNPVIMQADDRNKKAERKQRGEERRQRGKERRENAPSEKAKQVEGVMRQGEELRRQLAKQQREQLTAAQDEGRNLGGKVKEISSILARSNTTTTELSPPPQSPSPSPPSSNIVRTRPGPSCSKARNI